jgi:hypothetical protein
MERMSFFFPIVFVMWWQDSMKLGANGNIIGEDAQPLLGTKCFVCKQSNHF